MSLYSGLPSFADLLEFPSGNAKTLQSAGKLKLNSKVEVKDGRRLFIIRWNDHSHLVNICLALIPAIIARHTIIHFFSDGWQAWLVYALVYSMVIGVLDFWLRETKEEFLGDLPSSTAFLEFLDKFARGWPEKTEGKLIKIITFGKVKSKKWKIEYGILLAAHRLCEEDQPAFEKAVSKSRNKKELQWVMGIN